MNSFSRIITLLRKEKGITQKQAARDLGVSQALLSHYEKGLRECGLDFLVKLCDYYGVSSDYVLGRSPERNGSILNVESLEGAETAKDTKLSGSVLPAMNKRLISSSLNILFDMLSKRGNKELTTKVSENLQMSVYRVFRKLYKSDRSNDSNMFTVPDSVFEGYTEARILKNSADIDMILSSKAVSKQVGDAFSMTTESLQNEYPKHATALLNTIKTSEEIIK